VQASADRCPRDRWWGTSPERIRETPGGHNGQLDRERRVVTTDAAQFSTAHLSAGDCCHERTNVVPLVRLGQSQDYVDQSNCRVGPPRFKLREWTRHVSGSRARRRPLNPVRLIESASEFPTQRMHPSRPTCEKTEVNIRILRSSRTESGSVSEGTRPPRRQCDQLPGFQNGWANLPRSVLWTSRPMEATHA
jgi:hypothetical protein